WRDFRYPWPAAAAGARGPCRLRSHHPCRGVGSPDVLARLGALAPVHAVRGNVDHGAWSAKLPVTRRIEIDGFHIYVLHILAELDPQAAYNVDAVIYGHSHQPKIETKNGTLFFNPGSAGRCRFRCPARSTAGPPSMASCAPQSLTSGSSRALVDLTAARPGGNATGVNFFTAELAAKRHWMDDLDRKAPMMGAEVGVDYNAEVQK